MIIKANKYKKELIIKDIEENLFDNTYMILKEENITNVINDLEMFKELEPFLKYINGLIELEIIT